MEIAVQQNQAICDEVVALTKNGLEFTILYIYSYNNSLPAGGMQFSFPITNAYGDRLTKVYAGFYPSSAVGLLYNKSNATASAGGIDTGYGTNISSFTIYLNSVMLQYQQLVCANGDDYVF